MAEGKQSMFQGFKEFVMRGNVIDLAIAVVVGAAFGAVVKAFTDYIINPILAAVGGDNTAGWGFYINSDNPSTFIDIGAVIAALIQFLVTMVIIYYIFVVPMNKARTLARIAPKVEETPADILLLTEIRDLLTEQRSATTGAIGSPEQTD